MKYWIPLLALVILMTNCQQTKEAKSPDTTEVPAQTIKTKDHPTPQTQPTPEPSAQWQTVNIKDLGVSFQTPDSWSKEGKVVNSTDLKGKKTSSQLYFKDDKNGYNLLIINRLGKDGLAIHNYKQQQFKATKGDYAKNKKEQTIAGTQALIANRIIKMDGKGHTLQEPKKQVIVNLADKDQKRALEIQFTFPQNQEQAAMKAFNQFLSTLQFTK